MSYQVLARKWRPKNFHELVGQDHVRRALVSALDNDRLHHAYLFTGTRGVGKTTIARIIAKCLNCETGVTSRPCGTCTSCREIDEGRFVDLIEVDAASRTKVEDTRELLDNVQYAPSRGRYKVYLIDEVHMLSTHSFNALLKTLEEPPPHVKFLLATTDPQKLPVTVLSRCLQFNLKNMPPERVVEHLSHVLADEQIPFEDAALWQLGRAADGSMRDALSLTDQAIAYGQGEVTAGNVSEMLGLVDHRHVAALIEHLISRDAKALLNEVLQLAEQAADFETILSDMALYLHRMAIAHVLPDAVDNAQGDREQVLAQAARLTAEDVQLYYQIAIKSQQDLPLAPDARTGFEMALIRMVAFAPQGVPSEGGNPLPSQTAPVAQPVSAPDTADIAKKKALTPQSEPAPAAESLVRVVKPTREPAQNSTNSAPDDAAPTVQSARASLAGAGLRTVNFPTARPAQAEATPQPPASEPAPQPAADTESRVKFTPPVSARPSPEPAAPSSVTQDLPPWEEQPVAPPTSHNAQTPPAYDTQQPPAYDEPWPQADAPPAMPDYSAVPDQADTYQQMMPEPIASEQQPAPQLRDSALPDAPASDITPLVGACPAQLQNNQDWLQAFAHLPLRGLDRSLAKNAALISREQNLLKFALKAVTENFLTPERQESWLKSVQALFGDEIALEIVAFSTDLDTPEDYEQALKQQRQQQAVNLFASDPLIQGLRNSFGAEIDTDSIVPLI